MLGIILVGLLEPFEVLGASLIGAGFGMFSEGGVKPLELAGGVGGLWPFITGASCATVAAEGALSDLDSETRPYECRCCK